MFTVNISFNASTRMLTDDRPAPDYCIGTIGDNNSTKLVFTITDDDHVLDGMVGRVEFDVWVDGEEGEVFKPFIKLDQDNSVTLPADILKAVRRGVLPVQLAFGDDSGHEIYSLNTLMYRIAPAVSAAEAQTEVQPQVLEAYVSMEYDPETYTLTVTRINGSTTEIDLHNMKGDSFDYEWDGTSLIIKTVHWDDSVDESDPVNLEGDSFSFDWSGTSLTVRSVRNDGYIEKEQTVNLEGNSFDYEWNGSVLTVRSVKNDDTVVKEESVDLLGPEGDSFDYQWVNETWLKVDKVHFDGTRTEGVPVNLQGPQGPPAESTTPGEFVVRYIGDGMSTEFDVLHNLGTTHPFWQIQDMSGDHPVYMDVYGYAKTGNILHLVFTEPPALNSVAVLLSSGMGTARAKYEYQQLSATDTWTIRHNLGRKTSFTITDTAGTVIWCDEVVVDDTTTMEYFGVPTAGYAIER